MYTDRGPIVPMVDKMKVLGLEIGSIRANNCITLVKDLVERTEFDLNNVLKNAANIQKVPKIIMKVVEKSLISSRYTCYAPMLVLDILTCKKTRKDLTRVVMKYYRKMLKIPASIDSLTVCMFMGQLPAWAEILKIGLITIISRATTGELNETMKVLYNYGLPNLSYFMEENVMSMSLI